MTRRIVDPPFRAISLAAGLLLLLAAPAAMAAEAAGAEPTSPLYAPNQGAITGIVTIVIFILLLTVLGKYAWGPIVQGLKAREDRIRQDIADAEAARTKAEATLREYNAQLATAEEKIRVMMAKATEDAQKIATNLRMQAQQESEEIKERTNRDIEAARKAALSDIYAQAAELSTSIAEKILRRNLNADDQRDLVARSLEQLQSADKN